MSQKSNKTASEKKSPPKKAYNAPRLLIYGSVQEITRMMGASGKNDGGGGKDKTGP
ncbi:hypothetical protein BH18ACI4_BH18ACI4_06750 [soil metagenome]